MALTDFDAPQSRVEAILQNALGASNTVYPQSRVEELLVKLDELLEGIDDPEEFEQIVTDWLEENIEPGAAAVIDKTLTIEGAAADAKVVGTELTGVKRDLTQAQSDIGAETARAEAEEARIEALFTAPTQEAVDNWLDEHPEATTTVQDGAITIPKFSDETKDLIIIQADTEKAGYHDVNPVSVSFYPDSRLTDVTAKYSGSKNLLTNLFKSGKQNGVTLTPSGNLINLSGTGTGQVFLVSESTSSAIPALIRGKTYHAYLYIKKATAWGNSSFFYFYDGVGSYKGRRNFTEGGTQWIGWTDLGNITFSENATYLLVKFDSLNGTTFTDGDCVWVGLYETALTDTEQTVTGVSPYTVSISGLSAVDTATHESVAHYIESTKNYIDNHTPDIKKYWTEEIYTLPEYFGAVGDGVTDDTQAIADCIAYAKTSGKPIRGFNTYKVTDTVALDGRYLDVFIKEIVYTGSGAAIELQNTDIVFGFHTIRSNGIGLSFGHNAQNTAYAFRCQIKGNLINSASHCIEIKSKTYYNTIEARYLSTTSGNCINRNLDTDDGSGEYVFISSSCHCPNGWVAYDVGSSKFYNFTIEQDCKYGFLNPYACTWVGVRYVEQSTGIKYRVFDGDTSYTNGAYIKYTSLSGGRTVIKNIGSISPLHWFNFDLSAFNGYAQVGTVGDWQKLGFSGNDIGFTFAGVDAQSRKMVGEKAYIIGGHLVMSPAFRCTSIIDVATVDFTLFESTADADIIAANDLLKYLGTDYIIDISHADIYFNAYFGAVGYNDITITQANGNTATIYDKLGNVLFDGTNLGDGKWHLQCIVDKSSFGRYTGTTTWWLYDGTNEFWEITKIG